MTGKNMDYLALWGAVLSSLLAVVKFWEIWRNRRRVEISHSFSSPEIGNEVIIRNLGSTPLIITYWQLIWRHRYWFRWKQSAVMSADEDFTDLKLEGHSSTTIPFREENYFDWGVSALGEDRIYLRLHIAGEAKPILRKVYG
jgi:hypothetical protein